MAAFQVFLYGRFWVFTEALTRLESQVFAKFKPGQMISYSPELGAEGTFYRWRKQAAKDGKLAYSTGCYYVPLAKELRELS